MDYFNKLLRGLALGTMLCMVPQNSVIAADDSPAEISKKLNQLERQLRAVQRRVFKGGELPAEAVEAPKVNMELRQSLASMTAKISQIEREMRLLTGRLEEMEYAQRQMQQNIEIMQKDFALQMADLTAAKSAETPQATTNNTADIAVTSPEPKAVEPVAVTIALPEGDAASQYQYAFEFVRLDDMPSARKALELFLKTEPPQDFALNAHFWLGRVYLRSDQTARAAEQFLQVFEGNAEHGKAPESLVELAGSLSKLGSKDDACGVLAEFKRAYPDVKGRLQRRANAEFIKANCQ